MNVAFRTTSPPTPSPTNGATIASDSALFKLVTETEPLSSDSLFPNADAVTRGMLNGSTAHQPMVRVSVNAKVQAALQNGKLPPGSTFPDGSIFFKEIQTNGGTTTTNAVLCKDAGTRSHIPPTTAAPGTPAATALSRGPRTTWFGHSNVDVRSEQSAPENA